MFNLKLLGSILVTALKWGIVWGLAGAAVGAVTTLIEPDTGHIPRNLVPLMIGVPSAIFGAVAGLVFASVVAPFPQISTFLGAKGRVVLGGAVGGAAGIVFMNLLAHSVVTVFSGALLGAALGARFIKSESLPENR